MSKIKGDLRILLFLFFLLLPVDLLAASSSYPANQDFFPDLNSAEVFQDKLLNSISDDLIQEKAKDLGLTITAISLDEACKKALEKNLSIKLSEIDEKIVEHDISLKKAAFDPVLDFSIFYTMTTTFERSEDIARERRKEVNWEEFEDFFRTLAQQEISEEGSSLSEAICPDCEPCVYVDGVLINGDQCKEKYEFSTRKEYASIAMTNGSVPDTWVGALSLTKKFSWGQGVGINLQSTNRNNPYPPLGEYAALYTYDFDSPSYPYGENPWSSSLSLTLTSPMPFCKNFGEDATRQNIDPQLAEIERKSKLLQKQDVKNTILSEVHQAFWNLVNDLQILEVLSEAKINLKIISDKTARLYDEKFRTSYDKAQVETELGIMESRLELALNNFFMSSNRLAELLNIDGHVVFLPVEFISSLSRYLPESNYDSIYDAVKNRPDFNVIQREIDSNKKLYSYRKKQILPDLTLSLKVDYSQASSYFGYASLSESLANIFQPDNENYFIGILFKLPLGNRAAESNLTLAKLSVQHSKLKLAAKQNEIIKEVNIALNKLKSSESQLSLAEKKLDLNRQVYEKALAARNENYDVSDFEVLYKYRDLIDNQLDFMNSLILRKKAGVELLYVNGQLAELYK